MCNPVLIIVKCNNYAIAFEIPDLFILKKTGDFSIFLPGCIEVCEQERGKYKKNIR